MKQETHLDWPAGYGCRVLASVDSTNAEAARIAPGLRGPEWVLALEQTAAHGRRGRPWLSPPGNFAATLVMRPEDSAATLALRSFIAALALWEALVSVTGRAEAVALKWPNDVLLNGGKVAGILLEASDAGRGRGHLAIGIGVNLREAPTGDAVEAGALRPVSILSETGVTIGPEAFLGRLAPAFARYEAQFRAHGFAPIRRAWLDRAARLGEMITARTARETHEGRYETIDATGSLVLSTAQGRRTIAAADVFFR